MRLGDLESHIFISDFGDFRDEENGRKNKDKDADGEIHPLNTFKSVHVILGRSEEYIGRQSWGYTRADTVKCLGKVDPNLGVFWWSADY